MSDEQSHEELIQSALSSAFSQVSVGSATAESSSSAPQQSNAAISSGISEEAASAPAPLVSQEELERYEQERTALEQSWKEQSAIQRREAEERRARIAAERVASGRTWEKSAEEEGEKIRGPPNPIFNPRNVSGSTKGEGKGYPSEPSVADARDVVTGEPSKSINSGTPAYVSPPTTATLEQSQRWEEIESLESSYPSLSYPEQSDSAPSSEHGPQWFRHRSTKHDHLKKDKLSTEKPGSSAQRSVQPLPSATLAVFDSRLSTRSRLIALVSSLSINLLLPFINGVMLGFGEIFARNMASRFFGWQIPGEAPKRTPGGAATAVGVRAAGGRSFDTTRRPDL